MEEIHEVIPSAKRLIKSLRDIGYDFSTAIADLIDNSIEAGASRVDIAVGFYGDDSYVRISDNGKGMSSDELKEAMRYGTERDYSETDLGKFGLGLKTASLSQCQQFSVASRNKNSKEITIFSWDLSHIEKTDKWEIIPLKDDASKEMISSPLSEHAGTVVLWEKLDRIIGFKRPYGEAARKKLISMCRDLEIYLRMVFHKFLAKEVEGRQLDIFLNENKIPPWDPFARDELETKVLSPIKIKFIHEGVSGKLVMQPYILPTKDKFSSPDEFKNLSGPANWNQQQGLYIYRADRMIQSGGWCGLRTSDEHTKLSRIELNFSPVLDSAFKINVSKMKVQLPIQIRQEIENAIRPAILLARDQYDRERKSLSKSTPKQSPTPLTSNISSSKHIPAGTYDYGISESKSQKFFTLDEIEQQVNELANETEKDVISKLFHRLRKKLFGGGE